MNAVTEIPLSLPLYQRGKVRDVYDLGSELLLVSSDRISAFDFVLPSGVPQKGSVLNRMSAFWFRQTNHIIPNHMMVSIEDVDALEQLVVRLELDHPLPTSLINRSMIVKKARRVPVECVVRGYLSGSAWVEYQRSGTIAGKSMPEGLQESERLPEPLFTPTTKLEAHDRPLTEQDVVALGLEETLPKVEEASRAIYAHAAAYARERGIIVADTKFEFGWLDDRLILIDEALTPDSSRFWSMKDYAVGQPQPSYDKQPVRDWLANSGWNGKAPVPPLPPEVIAATTERYTTIYKWLTS
jgi:phosphoribosylaminoimidazole-succinocarboxamide synthase